MATITIKFDTDNAAFEDEPVAEVDRVLKQAKRKIFEQLGRDPRAVCNAPEAADYLYDINGNQIGMLTVTKGS